RRLRRALKRSIHCPAGLICPICLSDIEMSKEEPENPNDFGGSFNAKTERFKEAWQRSARAWQPSDHQTATRILAQKPDLYLCASASLPLCVRFPLDRCLRRADAVEAFRIRRAHRNRIREMAV